MNKSGLFITVTLLTTAVSYLLLRPQNYVQPLDHAPAEAPTNLNAHLSTSPERPKPAALTQLSLTVTDEKQQPAALLAHHGRLAHMMIVADDFSSFGHLHPEDFGELCLTGEQSVSLRHSLQYRFPTAGRYLASVNLASAESTLNQSYIIRVPGSQAGNNRTTNTATTQCFAGYPEISPDHYSSPVMSNEASIDCSVSDAYAVELQLPKALRANENLRVGYKVSRNGEALTTMQPYLAAGLHIAVVSEPIDRHGLQHIHGMPVDADGEIIAATAKPGDSDKGVGVQHHASADHHLPPPDAFGPRLLSEPFQFPARGRYWLFGQFKHDGNIVFTRFAVDVEAGFADSEATFIDLTLDGTQLAPSTTSVKQNENLVMRINHDDQQGELHITGYEIEKSLTTSNKTVEKMNSSRNRNTTEIRFNTELAGQFVIELHPLNNPDSDIPLGLLQVQPR